MPDLIFALIRTFVTLLVGATLTALANIARRELGLELEVDAYTKATLISGITAFVSMLWYAIFATLERRWPAFGVFLGWPKPPHYDHGEPPQELPRPRKSSTPDWRAHGADPLP